MKKLTSILLMLTLPLASTFSSFCYAQQHYISALSELQLSQLSTSTRVADAKRELAQDLALQYAQVFPVLNLNINEYNLVIDAETVFQLSGADDKILRQAELAIRDAKGLTPAHTSPQIKSDQNCNDTGSDNLMQIRLADASMLAAWQQGLAPLFAFAPAWDDKQWVNIEAYDVDGVIHLLDVYQLPQRPIFIIGLNSEQVLHEGLAVMRDTFDINTRATTHSKTSSANLGNVEVTSSVQPISTTVIKQISLKDTHEPWIMGKAEIYGIVTGVDPSRVEPILDVIDMPYLDYADVQYFPNQIIIHWSRYRWAAADLLLMEHDDDTNYRVLATALLNAAEKVLKAIPDPVAQGMTIIPMITNGILDAMPSSWFTNDDDFVDVFYTLQEGQTYTYYFGAGGNARATLTPLIIEPR